MHWAQATCAVVRVAVAGRVVVALSGPHVDGIVVETTATHHAVGAVADPSPVPFCYGQSLRTSSFRHSSVSPVAA